MFKIILYLPRYILLVLVLRGGEPLKFLKQTMKNKLPKSSLGIILSLLIMTLCGTQLLAVTPAVMGTLPTVLRESSGLAFTDANTFWTHNDGYGDENLYEISNTGTLLRTIGVANSLNHDWEDITQDAGKTIMFIGDFGNNNCDRTDLKIYIIPHPSAVNGASVTPTVINFTYPDQSLFPSPWMNFDVESFFHFSGKLYLFSKADAGAVGYTKMYSLPDQPGNYVATLVDSFYTNDRTTSADISPDGTTVMLMANSRIHLFRNFAGDNFFGGQYTKISISGSWTQKEAVSFSSNNEVFMTDEDNGAGSKLYEIDLSPWIPSLSPTAITKTQLASDNMVFPNPANTYFSAHFSGSVPSRSELKLFDLTGQEVRRIIGASGISVLRMETSSLPAGVYFYKLYADDKEVRTARLVISH